MGTASHAVLSALGQAVVTSTQTPVEEDFGRGPWLAMKAALGLDDGDPTCFLRTCSVAVVLQKVRSLVRAVPLMESLLQAHSDHSVPGVPAGGPEAAPWEQGAGHGRDGPVPDAQQCGRQCGAERPHG